MQTLLVFTGLTPSPPPPRGAIGGSSGDFTLPRVVINTQTGSVWYRYRWCKKWQRYTSLSHLFVYLEDTTLVLQLRDPVVNAIKTSNFALKVSKTGEVVHTFPLSDSKRCNVSDFKHWLVPVDMYDHTLCP